MFRLFLILFLAYQCAQAVVDDHATASYPRDGSSSSQSTRTMFNIVWGCVSTTIICAWTAVHPNIPPREGPLKRALRRLELMIWTIGAPEILPGWALNQRLAATTIRNVYNKAKGYQEEKLGIRERLNGWFSLYEITDPVNPAWTRKHGHFLMMGGIHLVEPVELEENSSGKANDKEKLPADVVVIATDAESGHPPVMKAKASKGRVTILTLGILTLLVKDPEFEISLTEDEIMDRSKGDALAKGIVMLQSLWFIAQCITRFVQKLQITQLELTTLALASFNALTFILWWDKPLGAQTPIYVYLKRRLTTDERNAGQHRSYYHLSSRTQVFEYFKSYARKIRSIVLGRSEDSIFMGWLVKFPFYLFFHLSPICVFLRLLKASLQDMMVVSVPVDATHVPTFYVPQHQYSEYWHILFFTVMGPVFGGLHCIGWNFPFPTTAKQELWHAAALSVTIIPICAISLAFIPNTWVYFKTKRPFRFFTDIAMFARVVTYVSVSLYLAARMTLLILAVLLLADPSPGALIAIDWTKFYPHAL